MYTDEIKHYGVLGMRWGVRKKARSKYTPRTGKVGEMYNENIHSKGDGRITIKPNTSLQRIGYAGSVRKGVVYASIGKKDNEVYIRDNMYLDDSSLGRNVLHLKTKTTLKSPSVTEARDILKTVLQDNPHLIKDFDNMADSRTPNSSGVKSIMRDGNEDEMTYVYQSVNRNINSKSASRVSEKFISSLKDKGYNMLRDEEGLNEDYVRNPLIVLDGAKNLKLSKIVNLTSLMQQNAEEFLLPANNATKESKEKAYNMLKKYGYKRSDFDL